MRIVATTAVTITVDDKTFARAERIAAKNGTDLSGMFQRYLELLATNRETFDREKLFPITRSARGLLKGLPDKPYDELLDEALIDKYGSGK